MDVVRWLAQSTAIEFISEEEISFPCPDCGKGKQHFQFNVKKGRGHCFKCDYSVDTLGLVAKIGRMSFEEAKSMIETWYGTTSLKPTIEQTVELRLPPDTGWTGRARDYLETRGILRKTIEFFGLYYCGRGRYASRVIFPIRHKGNIISFQARSVTDNKKRYLSGPKAGSYLYGPDDYHPGALTVIVEGPFDALKLWQSGYQAVATLGKSISPPQMQIIEDIGFQDVLLIYDSDAKEKIEETYEVLKKRCRKARVVLLDEGDPGDCEDLKAVMATATSNLREAKWDQLQRQLGIA